MTTLRIPCVSGDGNTLRIFRCSGQIAVAIGYLDVEETDCDVLVSISSAVGRALSEVLATQERIDTIAAGETVLARDARGK